MAFGKCERCGTTTETACCYDHNGDKSRLCFKCYRQTENLAGGNVRGTEYNKCSNIKIINDLEGVKR